VEVPPPDQPADPQADQDALLLRSALLYMLVGLVLTSVPFAYNSKGALLPVQKVYGYDLKLVANCIALLGVVLFGFGSGRVVNGTFTPHKFGVVAHAIIVSCALFVVHITTQDFEAHNRAALKQGQHLWFFYELGSVAGLASLLLLASALDLLRRNVAGILLHLIGTSYVGDIALIAVGVSLFRVADAQPVAVQTCLRLLGGMFVVEGRMLIVKKFFLVVPLAAVGCYYYFPELITKVNYPEIKSILAANLQRVTGLRW